MAGQVEWRAALAVRGCRCCPIGDEALSTGGIPTYSSQVQRRAPVRVRHAEQLLAQGSECGDVDEWPWEGLYLALATPVLVLQCGSHHPGKCFRQGFQGAISVLGHRLVAHDGRGRGPTVRDRCWRIGRPSIARTVLLLGRRLGQRVAHAVPGHTHYMHQRTQGVL